MTEKEITEQVRTGEMLGDFLTSAKPDEAQIVEVNKWVCESEGHKKLFDEITDEPSIAKSQQFYASIDSEKEFASFNKKRKRQLFIRSFRYSIPAAASIIIGLVIWLIPYGEGHNYPPPSPTSQIEIKPGSPKAILVLEDNRQIDLSGEKQAISDKESFAANSVNNELSYVTGSPLATPHIPRHRLITPIGGEYRLTLSDGTKVWMNADSELSYPVTFDKKEREVVLTGEAYFEVSKDANRPFHVKTDHLDVTVTGTAFNVSAYHEDELTKVTLVHGGVNVNSGNKLLTKLTPGKQIAYNSTTTSYHIDDADIESIIAWKEGLFIFKDEPLESIARKLGRWYNVEFIISEGLSGKYYSGKIQRDEMIDATLNILRLTNELDFRIKNNQTIEIIAIQ